MIHGLKSNLRAVERFDARFITDLLNQPSVQDGWGTAGVPVSIHRVERDIEQWLDTEWASSRPAAMIIESLESEPVGILIVTVSAQGNQNMATLSIAVYPDRQDAGHGRDALSALIAALFDEWRIHRIQVTCESGNERAAHLYESLGFTREATRVGATWTGGAFHDQHVYGLLSTDHRPGAANA